MTKYVHATVIVTTAVAVNLRKLSQMLDKGELDGMFTTALSATGSAPATHFISTGAVPAAYLNAITSAVKQETSNTCENYCCSCNSWTSSCSNCCRTHYLFSFN